MKISIEKLLNAPENLIETEFNEIISELGSKTPVTGKIEIRLTPYGVNITGKICFKIDFECDRCLKQYQESIDIEIDETLVKESPVSQALKEIEIKKENLVEELGNRQEIDITDIVYQSIILNIPSQKLCNPSCQGSKEYQELKKDKPIDPRLEIFKKLSENKDN